MHKVQVSELALSTQQQINGKKNYLKYGMKPRHAN